MFTHIVQRYFYLASVVNLHRMSESDLNTSVSEDESITDSSPAAPSVDSCSGTKATKSVTMTMK